MTQDNLLPENLPVSVAGATPTGGSISWTHSLGPYSWSLNPGYIYDISTSSFMWGTLDHPSHPFREACRDSVREFWLIWKEYLEDKPAYIRWRERGTPAGLIAKALSKSPVE